PSRSAPYHYNPPAHGNRAATQGARELSSLTRVLQKVATLVRLHPHPLPTRGCSSACFRGLPQLGGDDHRRTREVPRRLEGPAIRVRLGRLHAATPPIPCDPPRARALGQIA